MSGRGRGGRKRTGSSSGRGDRVAGRGSSTGLLGGGFTKKPKFYKYENTEVLLDDSIYPAGPPPDFAGRLYHYHVIRYNGADDAKDEDAEYVLRYEGKCIMPDGDTWATYAAASAGTLREEMEGVKYADIVAGMKRYNSAVTRITDKTLSEDAKIKAELKLVGGEAKKESDEVDTSDLAEVLNEMGGKTNDVMALEFELTGESNDKRRQWRHKRLKERTFFQSKAHTKSADGWDTGVWTKQLRHIAQNKRGVNGDRIAITRAKFILMHRSDKGEDALTKVSS